MGKSSNSMWNFPACHGLVTGGQVSRHHLFAIQGQQLFEDQQEWDRTNLWNIQKLGPKDPKQNYSKKDGNTSQVMSPILHGNNDNVLMAFRSCFGSLNLVASHPKSCCFQFLYLKLVCWAIRKLHSCETKVIWLVVWNIIFFSHIYNIYIFILGIILPIDFHIFQRAGSSTNHSCFPEKLRAIAEVIRPRRRLSRCHMAFRCR